MLFRKLCVGLGILAVSFGTIAATLPQDADNLSFEEIKKIVNGLELKREDCNIPTLMDLTSRILYLLNEEKITLEASEPYTKKIGEQMKSCRKARLQTNIFK